MNGKKLPYNRFIMSIAILIFISDMLPAQESRDAAGAKVPTGVIPVSKTEPSTTATPNEALHGTAESTTIHPGDGPPLAQSAPSKNDELAKAVAPPTKQIADSPATPPTPVRQQSDGNDSHRASFIDTTAAIFGILAVFFALLTLVVTVWGLVSGLTKISELLTRVETELNQKIDLEFKKRLEVVVEVQIKPRVLTIINTELKETLETARTQIQSEISKTFEQTDLKTALIAEVASEIQLRLARPVSQPVNQGEFS